MRKGIKIGNACKSIDMEKYSFATIWAFLEAILERSSLCINAVTTSLQNLYFGKLENEWIKALDWYVGMEKNGEE